LQQLCKKELIDHIRPLEVRVADIEAKLNRQRTTTRNS
jgi:hypothetical protein